MRYEQCEKDEMFVGNTSDGERRLNWLASQGLKTARIGHVALCIDGKPLPRPYVPIFIKKRERDRHHAIMMQATFGNNWRSNG